MENGAFAPMEQMLHFPYNFEIYDISKALLWSKGLNMDFMKPETRLYHFYSLKTKSSHIAI